MRGHHLFPLLAMLLAACSQNNAALDQELKEVETRLETLTDRVKELENKRSLDELTKGLNELAYLTPGAEGYSTVRFDLGVLTVRLVDVKPDASRIGRIASIVKLEFGNPLSSSLNGLNASIYYGKVDAKGLPDNDIITAQHVAFSQQIKAGAWTPVSVVLEVRPAELGFVRVRDVVVPGIGPLKDGYYFYIPDGGDYRTKSKPK